MIPQIIHTGSFVYKAYPLMTNEESYLIWEARNNGEIRKYMTNPQPFSFNQHATFVASLKSRDDALYYAVLKEGTVIGSICLNPYDADLKEGEMGKFLFPEYGGKGLGYSFVKEFLDYMFSNGHLKTCFARTFVDNLRNQHVNNKLGFVETKRDERYVYMELYKSQKYSGLCGGGAARQI